MRNAVRFGECAAWFYPGTGNTCVIMAGGTAVTKGPASDKFAPAFQAAGFSALAFDFRHFGESGGQPRQLLRLEDQIADWNAAVAFALGRPGVERVALWGFSLAGGEVLQVAAGNPAVSGVIAQSPLADGRAVLMHARRFQTIGALLKLTWLGLTDRGSRPKLVPLAGRRGTVAALTTPDALDGDEALNPGNRHPDWKQLVAARSVLRLSRYRPIRFAAKVHCPLLVVACEQDQSVLPGPARKVAELAPQGELFSVPGGHYAPFLAAFEQVVAAEIEFLKASVSQPAPLLR